MKKEPNAGTHARTHAGTKNRVSVFLHGDKAKEVRGANKEGKRSPLGGRDAIPSKTQPRRK